MVKNKKSYSYAYTKMILVKEYYQIIYNDSIWFTFYCCKDLFQSSVNFINCFCEM